MKAIAKAIAPAGEYFLGDPSYAVPDSDDWWGQLLQSCDLFRDGPVGQLPDGTKVIAFGTAYGDGEFADNRGNVYPVDAGLIGLVPVTEVTEAALASKEQRAGPLMTRVRFDKPVRCTSDFGRMRFGPYHIDTTE